MTTESQVYKISKVLDNVNGSSFISMDTTTIPKLKGGKKNPMQGRVRKHNHGASIMVFQNKKTNAYDNMVKRRLLSEGKDPDLFKLSPRAWGTRLQGTPLVEHKGALYLEVIFLASGKTSYTLDGQPIDRNDIEGFEWPHEKEEGKQGGLDDKVIIRTFKLDSVDRIKIGDKQYTKDDWTA
jgi:hypothetical protein